MSIETKILSPDDTEVLQHIAPDDVFDYPINPRLVDEFLHDPRHHLVVALDDGMVVGFVSGVTYIHPDKPIEMWINEVGVAAGHRRLGIGAKMVRAMCAHARALGCREAWVLTDRANHPAMRLYASCGGVEAPKDQVMFTFFLDE